MREYGFQKKSSLSQAKSMIKIKHKTRNPFTPIIVNNLF